MVRVDLHTHSEASPDGGLSAKNYHAMLHSGRLQTIAITDHDRVDFALKLHEELGNAVIVGEEITAQEGEIIGLYLHEAVPGGLTAHETARRIHEQGGLVYIPHPFETVRKGISPDALSHIAGLVDIIETYNGRTLQNRGDQAQAWAIENQVPQASSSDAHGWRGWGNTASILSETPTRRTLADLLSAARHDTASTGLVSRLYPKLNRLKQRVGRA